MIMGESVKHPFSMEEYYHLHSTTCNYLFKFAYCLINATSLSTTKKSTAGNTRRTFATTPAKP